MKFLSELWIVLKGIIKLHKAWLDLQLPIAWTKYYIQTTGINSILNCYKFHNIDTKKKDT